MIFVFRMIAFLVVFATVACESTLHDVKPMTTALTEGKLTVFNNVEQFEGATVLSTVTGIRTLGYYSEGDGGGALYYKVPLAEDSLPGDKLSNDGSIRWRLEEKEELSVRVFGAHINGVLDDIIAINKALRYSSLKGTTILQPAGIMMVSDEIVIPNGALWRGGGRINTFVKKTENHSGRMLISEGFDMQTGNTNINQPGLFQDVSIKGMTFDGTWMSADKSAYINDDGDGGLFLYTARSCYLVDVRVQNMCGIGVFVDAPLGGLTGSPVGMGRSGILDDLYIETTKEEGLIYRGIPDRTNHNIFQWNAGARINSEDTNPTIPGPRSSPTYGATNGGRTDGVVLWRAMENVFIHSFGNPSGLAIRIADGRYNNCFFLAETSRYGGISVDAGYGDNNVFQAFRTGGGGIGAHDSRPMVYFNSPGTANLNYGNSYISAYHNNTADTSPRASVVFGSQSRGFVGQVKTRGDNVPGHGIVIESAANFIDIYADVSGHLGNSGELDATGSPIQSSGIYRKASSSDRSITIRGKIRNCAVGFRSQGTPRLERVDLDIRQVTGQIPFIGDVPTLAGQQWNIIADVGGVPTIINY